MLKFINSFRSTFSVLGLILSGATIVSIIKNGFNIPLSTIPEQVYFYYVWMRDTLFYPLDTLFLYINISIPGWAKDIISLYIVISVSYLRALLIQWQEKLGDATVTILYIERWNIIFWFTPLFKIIKSFIRYKQGKGFLIAPAVIKNKIYLGVWTYSFTRIIIGVFLFFLWNYISSNYVFMTK